VSIEDVRGGEQQGHVGLLYFRRVRRDREILKKGGRLTSRPSNVVFFEYWLTTVLTPPSHVEAPEWTAQQREDLHRPLKDTDTLRGKLK